jgi:type VI secretion system protein ImpA
MPVNSELLATLLAPIPGDAPAGRDLRYEPEYAAFREERREDVLIPGTDDPNRKVADWAKAVVLGTELVGKRTKDLQLAAWLTEALIRRNGLSGLITGLETLRGILDQYWDTCFPEMEDGDHELRVGPLEWVGSKLTLPTQSIVIASGGVTFLDHAQSRTIPHEDAVSGADYETQQTLRTARAEAEAFGKRMPEAVDTAIDNTGKVFYKAVLADVDTALASLAALEKSSDERFGNDAPAYTELRKVLDDLRRFAASTLARKLETDPDPITESAPEAAELETAASAESDGPQNPEPTSGKDAAQRLTVVARWFRQQDATNPAPYAMVRAFRWGELRTNAPEVDPRLLEAPPTAIRARLKGLLLDGRWNELLEQGEALMVTPAGRGWLDLQRYALTACANLGGSYDGVAAVIRSELRALLVALPTLPKMTLMDDTPAANDETREWLDAEVLADAEADPTDAETGDAVDSELSDGADLLSDAIDDDVATGQQGGFGRATRRARAPRGRDVFDIARNELALGRPNRAIELLSAELARDTSPRGRFVRQTQLAYVMVEAGLDAVAQPILQRLIEIINERNLDQWEAGPLVAQPIALMCRVIDRTGGDETARYDLYLRLCRLDPLQALALQAR